MLSSGHDLTPPDRPAGILSRVLTKRSLRQNGAEELYGSKKLQRRTAGFNPASANCHDTIRGNGVPTVDIYVVPYNGNTLGEEDGNKLRLCH